jgi:hypothetical protein
MRYKEIEAFESSLKPGDEVEARWTNSHRAYRAVAKVVRVNRESIRVELCETITDGAHITYPQGWEIVLPRFWARTYSANNSAQPRVSK